MRPASSQTLGIAFFCLIFGSLRSPNASSGLAFGQRAPSALERPQDASASLLRSLTLCRCSGCGTGACRSRGSCRCRCCCTRWRPTPAWRSRCAGHGSRRHGAAQGDPLLRRDILNTAVLSTDTCVSSWQRHGGRLSCLPVSVGRQWVVSHARSLMCTPPLDTGPVGHFADNYGHGLGP